MDDMFSYCSSLTSLDLSNFNTSEVIWMDGMFSYCSNLEYINIQNFKNNKDIYFDFNYIFDNIPINIVVCINETDDDYNMTFLQLNQNCMVKSCSDNWKSEKYKITPNENCTKNCLDNPPYIYEYNGKCVENCSNGYINVNSTNKICKCELDKCLTCPQVALNKDLCTKCNIGYYPKENDEKNIGEYINCYNEIEGYYLDIINNIYKKCYYSCKTCEIIGNDTNHNCLICNSNYTFEININNYTNCYEKCNYYYYIDDNNIFHCTNNNSCPFEYKKLIN